MTYINLIKIIMPLVFFGGVQELSALRMEISHLDNCFQESLPALPKTSDTALENFEISALPSFLWNPTSGSQLTVPLFIDRAK